MKTNAQIKEFQRISGKLLLKYLDLNKLLDEIEILEIKQDRARSDIYMMLKNEEIRTFFFRNIHSSNLVKYYGSDLTESIKSQISELQESIKQSSENEMNKWIKILNIKE